MRPDMNALLKTHDVVFLVLDSLRYDVAATEFAADRTPNIAQYFPTGWQKRHAPGSFTFASHQAFFAGFLPTPAEPGEDGTRLFACKFHGSESTGPTTKLFQGADWITGLAEEGFRT